MVILISLYLQLNQSNKPSRLLRSSVLVEERLIGLVLILCLAAALLELDRHERSFRARGFVGSGGMDGRGVGRWGAGIPRGGCGIASWDARRAHRPTVTPLWNPESPLAAGRDNCVRRRQRRKM